MNKFKVIFLCLIVVFMFGCKSTKPVQSQSTETVVENIVDEEYVRSINDVSVSWEEFSADKKEILRIIAELSTIMAERNYEEWLNYIEPESKVYWSNPINLRKASKRLPIRGQRLNNLNDYFVFVFVPSRKNQHVDEIRYISRDNIKAVQVRDSQDVVYYNFRKINNTWMISIPPLQS